MAARPVMMIMVMRVIVTVLVRGHHQLQSGRMSMTMRGVCMRVLLVMIVVMMAVSMVRMSVLMVVHRDRSHQLH